MWGKINLYKAQDMSSQQAVTGLRRILGIKKIGHSGTLDPMATGVLNCFVGRATRFIDLLAQDVKVYRASFILGKTSDTLDIWGNLESHPFEQVDSKELEEALGEFLGESYQEPPMYSALKYQGRSLYSYAREGLEIQRESRRIFISKIQLLDFDGYQGNLEVHCGRGTYIRSLIDDLGRKLGCGALMSGLIRLENDWASLEDCYTLEEIEKMYKRGDLSFLRSPDENVDLPRLEVDRKIYEDLALGRIKDLALPCDQRRYLLYQGKAFIGTAQCIGGKLERERIVQVDNDT